MTLLKKTLKNEGKQEPYMIIDLHKRYSSTKLHARLIWQVLFNEYRIDGDLDQMDSMLCDLYTIQAYFEAWQSGVRATGFKFIWYYDRNGYTTIEDEVPLPAPELESDRAVHVEFDPQTLSVKLYRLCTPKDVEEATI